MKKISLTFLGLLFSLNAFAMTPQEKSVFDIVQKSYPELKTEDVIYLPEVKLFELKLKTSTSLTFTNSTVDYFYSAGELIDPKNKKSVSVERSLVGTQQFFKNLPVQKSIVVKYGKGTRKVAIFSDPDCPFCKSLDKEIHSKLTNQDITFYYYMNPLRIPGHEDAPLKARKIWCSNDKSKAWVAWMTTGKLPNNNGSCKNPVDETKALSDSVGFNSTPTLIFDNGVVLKSAAKAEDIINIFGQYPAPSKTLR